MFPLEKKSNLKIFSPNLTSCCCCYCPVLQFHLNIRPMPKKIHLKKSHHKHNKFATKNVSNLLKVFQALLYCSHSPRFFHSSLFIRDAILCCDVIWRKSVRKISKFTPKFTVCILSWVQYLSTLSEIKLSFTFQFFCLSVLLSFCMFSLFSWEQGNGFWKSISYRLLQYCLEIYFRNVHYSSHWVEVLVSTTFHFRINQTDAAYLRTQRYLNFWSWSWLVSKGNFSSKNRQSGKMENTIKIYGMDLSPSL